MAIQQAIQHLVDKKELSHDEMIDGMQTIMTGQATDAQIGAFLIGLRMKGETVNEITAAAQVMRMLSNKVEVSGEHIVDTCGTGGDSSGTFNISTAASFVTAAAGAKVAKHGNRSISSQSGSADLLEAAGVSLTLSPEQVGSAIKDIGIGFMFAPAHHSAMKHAIRPRKEIGVRTIFNILGPLTNPAGAPNQVLGVFTKALVRPLVEVLQKLGSKRVLVVHAEDGLDEISINSKTYVSELRGGEITDYVITPMDFGLQHASLESIKVADVNESLEMVNQVFNNQPGPARDIVAMNAGAAIYVCGLASSLQQGVEKAKETIASGAAKAKLTELVNYTKTCS